MLVVLVMGATVTTTGSAQGCGRDWPLCRGQFIPTFAVSTFIEFSHRAVTGVESVLVVSFAAALWALWHDRRPARLLAPLMVAGLLAQAGMGAWAVKYPQASAVLALHFGLSLIALAAVSLGAVFAHQAWRRAVPGAPAPPWLRTAAAASVAYLYLLVYSGAFIRHIGAAPVCHSWPLCQPGAPAGVAVAVDLLHRFGALLALVLAAALVAGARRAGRPDLVRRALGLLLAVLAQGAAGAYLVSSGFDLGGELLHAGMTGVLFVCACLLWLQSVLPWDPAGGRADAAVLARQPVSA
jgi:cytochrome c oxidase assembly protein subunit 15